MAHHGWISVLDPRTLAPSALKSPFGRLFEASNHAYDSLALSLLAGARGPIEQTAPTPPTGKPGNAAGFTFLGQFIDHDMTEFRVVAQDLALVHQNPTLGQRQRVLEDGGQPTATNGRIPSLDLDSVYGLLGVAQPDLYDDDGLFLLDGDVDILRGAAFNNGRLIADPRNDENKLIVQIHILFQRLHNAIHAAATGSPADKRPGGDAFKATKLEVQNAYRRIVLHDYLPNIVQKEHIDAVLTALAAKTTLYQAMTARAREAYLRAVPSEGVADLLAMPVEFAHAAFRLGHSQLRDGYALNARGGAPLFAPGRDLRGRAKLTDGDFVVDWELFFDAPGQAPTAQHGEPLDARLTKAVFRLPPPSIGEPPASLAERNIRRGVDFGLPSGQEAAARLTGVYGGLVPGLRGDQLFPPSEFGDFPEILQLAPSLVWATPLWYYILREAGLHTADRQLGAVGGLIVAETLLGSLDEIQNAEFDLPVEAQAAPPVGKPSSPAGIASMAQLLQFIGVFS